MIKKLRVTVDGKPYDVTVEVPDEPGAPMPASAPPPARAAAPTASSPTPPPSAPPAAAPGDVPSPLMGRVVAVHAKPGQKVEQGDRLVTIETMKMNTFVVAHKAGTVAEMLVAVGDTVSEGVILARLA